METLEQQAPALAELPVEQRTTLSGRKKAAVLLVSLGADRAADVFKYLDDEEIEGLSLEMAQTAHIPPDDTESVFAELIENSLAADFLAEGGVDFARQVLERAVGPDRAAEILGRLAAVIEMRPFEFLRHTPAEQIAAFLGTESPQTIALVVANLHTRLAAEVLSELPVETQADVAMRIATMSDTRPEIIKDVEEVLRQKLSNVISQDYAAAGGVEPLAEILTNTDRATERNVLDKLAEFDTDLAEQIRMLLFIFEDIVKLDDRAVQLVLKEVDQKDLVLALRGVPEEVKEKVLRNMSQRGSEMILEEMEYQQPQRRAVIEEAQGRIVAAIRRLEDSGAIAIGRGSGEDGSDDQLI